MLGYLRTLIFGYLLFISAKVQAQIPTVQDCLGAIPICQTTYTENNAYQNTGNYPNEINPSLSCLSSGEKNDVWYVFTVQTSGVLNFSITPNVLSDDYDWAVYNLTSATCAQIFSNPGLEVACNYSGVAGVTGPNGLPGLQNSPTIPVIAGQTYVINISQFSVSLNGYTIDFGASTAQIFDNIPPAISSVTSPVPCGSDSIVVTFTENVRCNSVQATDFSISGPLSTTLTVTSAISSACAGGATYGKTYVLHFSPAINLAGPYNLVVLDTILDVCNNCINFPANFAFVVNPIVLNQVQTNVTCPGGSNGTATVNVTSGGTPPYTYLWTNGQTTQTATGLSAGAYTVTVTPSGNACPTPLTLNITAPTAFNVIPNITGASCGTASGSASINVSGGTGTYTYLWSSGSTTASATSLFAGNYTVTVTDASSCTYVYNLIVPTTASIVASISLWQNVSCFGGNNGNATASATSGSGSYTYLWSNGQTNAIATNLVVGTYTVTITDIIGGCTSTTSIAITQPSTAVGAASNSTATSCNLANGSASVAANGGTPGYTYLWNNGNTTNGLINIASGTYTVTVTDSKGCTISVTATVAASTAPVLNLTSSSNVSCFGGNNGAATVNCTGCTGITNYQWSGSGTTSSNNSLGAGTYTVTVTDGGNCTATLSITINQPAQLIPDPIPDDTVCLGNGGSLLAGATGGVAPYTFLWSNGQTTSSLNSAPGVTSGYTVTITDTHNCTTSATASIIVRPALSVITANDTSICYGQSITINAIATGGDNNYTYNWNSGLAFGNFVNITPSQDTTLNVVVTDGCGSPPVSHTVQVNVSQAIVLNISATNNVTCYGGNNGSAIVSIVSGGTAPMSYSWSNGATNSTVSNITAGTYTVTVTDQVGCTATVSALILQPSAVVLNTSGNVTICSGRDTTLSIAANGGVPPYNYLWNTGSTATSVLVTPNVTSTFTVIVTDDNNCVHDTTYLVTVLPPLAIAGITPSQDLCKGKSINIHVTASGGNGSYSYNWNSGLSSAQSFISAPLQDTTYTVTVSDGCTIPDVTASLHINVIEAPVVNFSYIPDKGCQPLLVTFTDSTQTVPGSSYLWKFGNGNISSLTNPKNLYKNFGLFGVTLTVTTPQGCVGYLTKTAIILVYEKPVAEFTFEPSVPTLYTPNIYFHDRSSGINSTWYWEFGDGGTSMLQNPWHAYSDTGSYPIVFATTNNEGCSDTIHYMLHIKDEYAFYIPNAFTPNNNGFNDYFTMNGVNFKSFEVQIFNRHGHMIHHSANQVNAWDGRDEKGQIVQEGTYAYQVIVYEPTGKRHTYTGTVNVIR